MLDRSLSNSNTHSRSEKKFAVNAMAAAFAALTAFSYNASAQEEVVEEELIVTGARAEIQNLINLKRNATTIVDGMSADEIGEIPALSVGEALETITGATSHRENGGATEVSVRGLGPFLGTTVVNGREATNGGGNRAVNFSIFPSEMFNAISIHKTQSAEYIEGAVSGQVHLDTRRPLEYGKRLLQVDLKAAYSPDEADIDGGQDFGQRGTFGYIDQFDFDGGGALGVSLGIQLRDESNPEQEYTTGTGGGRLEACELESFDSNALPTDTDGRCENVSNDEIQALLDDPDKGYDSVEDIPFAYLARDRRYRRNTTGDEREAVFGAIQWQPNDVLDIMFDFQYSERDQTELRQDLQFGTTQEDISLLESNPYTGVPYRLIAETDIRANTTDFQRLEEYEGFGLNVAYQITDDLRLSFDAAYSDTVRTETDIEINLGATDDGIVADAEDFFVDFDLDPAGTNGVALANILSTDATGNPVPQFDITDPTFFTARNRAQLRARQIIRENTITAFRSDIEWDTDDLGFINVVKGGARFSSLEYLTLGGNRSRPGINEWDDEDFDTDPSNDPTAQTDAIVLQAATNCGQSSFPESGFLSEQIGGNDLFTNANGLGNGSEFATFDFNCLGNTLLQNYGGLAGISYENGIETSTNDVTEDTIAVYLQADFEFELAGFPARGNFGVRVVDTEITSVGYRSAITVEETDEGFEVQIPDSDILETDEATNSYTEVLPSATLIVDLTDELVLRTGAFRGLSRPDPNAYGNGRDVRDGSFDTLEEAINGIPTTGNPFLEPLTSTNFDIGIEWYANEDTLLAANIYYKNFNGAFENVAQQETFNLDGQAVTGSVTATQVSDDSSDLHGLEITATHAFDYLPSFWGGFGIKFSYNYADSNFEFEDGNGGDGVDVDVDENGNVTETDLIGILPPAGLFGLSEHVSSTQLYWQQGDFSVSAIYKTRSDYFQEFTRDTTARVRYTDDNETLDLRMKYKVTDNVTVSFEGKNLTDEPRRDFRGVDGNVTQVLSYGPRYFFGVRVKY